MTKSALQIARAAYQPKLPKALTGAVVAKEGEPTQSVADQEEIKKLFPNTYGMPLIQFVEGEAKEFAPMNVGVILSGGQAPGGHNVISGLFDGIKKLNPANKLYGFILGPGGLVDHNYMELTADIIDEYRNTGGFDIIGSGRTKLEKDVMAQRQTFAQKAQAFEQDRARRSNEERGKLVTRIQTAVQSVAKDQSIDLVVDANAVAYNSSDVKDITADVLKQVK